MESKSSEYSVRFPPETTAWVCARAVWRGRVLTGETAQTYVGKEHVIPSVSLARPPVGWARTVLQLTQRTTVWAWLNTVVIL